MSSTVDGYGVQKEGQNVKFRKLWRLRELEVKEEFAEGVHNKCASNEDWCCLKKKLDVASEVCGYSKSKPRHFETRWWNKDANVAVRRNRVI